MSRPLAHRTIRRRYISTQLAHILTHRTINVSTIRQGNNDINMGEKKRRKEYTNASFQPLEFQSYNTALSCDNKCNLTLNIL